VDSVITAALAGLTHTHTRTHGERDLLKQAELEAHFQSIVVNNARIEGSRRQERGESTVWNIHVDEVG